MATHRKAIEALIDRLERRGANIVGLDLGAPMAAGLDDLLVDLGGARAPTELLDLYREIDGAALMWSVEAEGRKLAGGFNLHSISVAMARNGSDADRQPLEGVLWTGDEAPDVLALLRRMVVFDSVPGRNDFMAFAIDAPKELYLIADGIPLRINPSLDEVVDSLIAYGGADSLREHFTHDDWRHRIAVDPALLAIERL